LIRGKANFRTLFFKSSLETLRAADIVNPSPGLALPGRCIPEGDVTSVALTGEEPTEDFVRDFVVVATGYYVTEPDSAPAKVALAIENKVPTEYALGQNYPNPFNPVTEIEFSLPQATKVTLTVYNLLGQVVEVVVDSQLDAGYHAVRWNRENAASGIYFYQLTCGEFQQVRKMLLLK